MTRPRFDLVAAPWIPVVTHDGRHRLLGLGATLEGADGVAEIVGDDPLVTAALLRLLLAVADRIQPVDGLDDWAAAWRRGRLDPRAVQSYLGAWRDRFDLFHPDHPFAQGPPAPGAHATTVAQLVAEHASGNNATIASHVLDARPPRTTPVAAARHLLAHLAFAASGRIPNHRDACRAAPLRHGVLVTLAGDSLYQTLLLNQLARGTGLRPTRAEEVPLWERPDPGAVTAGWLERLVWPARRITLHPAVDSSGISVSSVTLCDGAALPADAGLDAMHAGGRARKGQPCPVLRPRAEGQAWRDVLRVLPATAAGAPPAALVQLQRLVAGGHLPPGAAFAVRWLGLAARHAKNLAFVDELTPLPAALLVDDAARERLERALAHAEATARSLKERLGLADPGGAGVPGADADAVRTAAAGGEAIFWAALAPHARALVRDVAATPGAVPGWHVAVRHAAQRASDAMARRLGRAALRAAVWFGHGPSSNDSRYGATP